MALLHLRNQSRSFRRSLVPGLIGDVTLDHSSKRVRPPRERIHLLGKFSQRFVQPLAVPLVPLCVLLQPVQRAGQTAECFPRIP